MTCRFEGCGRPYRSHGLCSTHYAQQLAGEPLKPIRTWVRGGTPCVRCTGRAANYSSGQPRCANCHVKWLRAEAARIKVRCANCDYCNGSD